MGGSHVQRDIFPQLLLFSALSSTRYKPLAKYSFFFNSSISFKFAILTNSIGFSSAVSSLLTENLDGELISEIYNLKMMKDVKI